MPDWKKEILQRMAPLRLDGQREAEIAEEMSQHLDDRYAELRGTGLDDAAARAAALAELSGLEAYGRDLRRVGKPAAESAALGGPRGSVFEAVRHDVRYALRTFRSHPAFAAVAILTFAIGIGGCTLIFSAVQGVIRRPLPYPEPDQLVEFFGTAPEKGLPEVDAPTGLLNVYFTQARSMSAVAAYGTSGMTLTGHGDPERLDGALVTRDFFTVFGLHPRLGRTFVAGEDVRDAPPTVVLSHALWQRKLNGDTTIVGKTIELNARAFTVLGVMPPGFQYPARAEFWTPLAVDPNNFGCWCFSPIGRMKPGVTAPDVAREIASIVDEFGLQRRDVFPDAKRGGARIIAEPLAARVVGDLQRPLLVLLGAVALVLLIGCANIANLALVRATARNQEIAVRCCLGAGPRRIAAQLMTESLLLSMAGAAAGLAVATIGMGLLRGLPVEQFPRMMEVRVDPVVLAFTVAVAMVAGLLCGLAPALRVWRVDLQDAIKSGARGTQAGHSRRWSDGFVVTQFALSFVLLVGAGLLLRSYQRLSNVDLGYRPENVLVGRITLPYPKYDTSTVVRAFYLPLVERVRAIPGVTDAGLNSRVPLARGNPQNNIMAEGLAPQPGQPVRVANVRIVTPGYFRTIGTPLLEGRDFQFTDTEQSPRVAVVDEALARHFWPNESALGKRVFYGGDTSAGRFMTVVGVVRNVKHRRPDEMTDLQIYEPFTRIAMWNNFLVVRSTLPPEQLTPQLRAEIQRLDPTLPLYEVRTMREAVRSSMSVKRLVNLLLGGFALTALLLAAIGIYGVISLSVNSRVREFGIRLALGARAADIRALVLRQGILLATAGVAIGLTGAVYLTRFVQKLLFGVEPLDLTTFVAVAVVLSAAAVLASYLPARRATRADPALALHAE